MFHLSLDFAGKVPSKASDLAEADNKTTSASLLRDIWYIIFDYEPSIDIAKVLRPDLIPHIERSKIVVIKSDLRSVAPFLHALARQFPSDGPGGVSLRALISQYEIFEQPTNQIDRTFMLTTVVAQSSRLKQELIEFLDSIDRTVIQTVKKDFPDVPFSFLTNLLSMIGQISIHFLHNGSKKTLAQLISSNELVLAEFWVKALYRRYRLETFRFYDDTIDYFLERRDPDSAQTLLKLIRKYILPERELLLMGKIIDCYLDNEDIAAWKLLIPRAAPKPTLHEIAAADRDLATIQSLFGTGQISLGFELARTRIADLDSITKALKFPDHCFEFLKLVSEFTKEQLFDLIPPEERPSVKPILDLLEFVITCFPDGQRKKELLQHKKLRQLCVYRLGILMFATQGLEKRPDRLCRLAIICLKKGYHQLAFEAATHIEDPQHIYPFIVWVRINNVKLSSEESRLMQGWTQDLPPECRDRLNPPARFEVPNEVLSLMLSYVDPETAFIAKGIGPRYVKAVDKMSLIALRQDIKGASTYINAIIQKLESIECVFESGVRQQIYTNRKEILKLKSIAEGFSEVENFQLDPRVNPSVVLFEVSQRVSQLRVNFWLPTLAYIPKCDLSKVNATVIEKAPPFLEDLVQVFQKSNPTNLFQNLLNHPRPKIDLAVHYIPDMPIYESDDGFRKVVLAYVNNNRADRAITLLNQVADDQLSPSMKTELRGVIIDALLNQNKPFAWDLLKPSMQSVNPSSRAQNKEDLMLTNSRLYKLAKIFIDEGDIERAFEVAKLLCSPPAIFDFLDSLMNDCINNQRMLTTQQKEVYMKLAHALPSEFKFLLIHLARDKEQHSLANALQQGFDRDIIHREALKQFNLILDSRRILQKLFAKDDLNDDDIYNILLWLVEDGKTIKELITAKKSAKPGYKRFEKYHEQMVNIYTILPFLSAEKALAVAKEVNEWSVGLKGILIAFASDFRSRRKADSKPYDILISALEKQIKSSEQEVKAKLENDFNCAVITPKNPFVGSQEYLEVISSDLFIAQWVMNRIIRNCSSSELELIGENIDTTNNYMRGWIGNFLRNTFINPWASRGISIQDRVKTKQ